ncbi:MAG: hypothetical protein IPP29_21455 [Bacteroidetes bacterium]|nr:hypothetical protein [Bacteroidota bacterium]
MRYINFIFQNILILLKAVCYEGFAAIIPIIKRFYTTLCNFIKFQNRPHPAKNDVEEGCNQINEPAFHRPDPCIYSQSYLTKLGLPITWDNPDIFLIKDGNIVAENQILPDTHYEVHATIWNNSYEAPVVGLPVKFGFLSFGASTLYNSIAGTTVNLGVKGGANHPAHAKVIWKTPSTPGHYCLQVDLDWVDDSNTDNNMGQNNLTIIEAHSPATFNFKLKNNTSKHNRYRFEVDTYTLPAPATCEPKQTNRKKLSGNEKLEKLKTIHNKANFPIPTGWTVVLSPLQPSLLPDEEVDIDVSITPPDSFVGKMPFNINAYYNKNDFAGGVTLYVVKN